MSGANVTFDKDKAQLVCEFPIAHIIHYGQMYLQSNTHSYSYSILAVRN